MLLPRHCYYSLSVWGKIPQRQCVHSSATVLYPKKSKKERADEDVNVMEEYDVNDIPHFEEDDATSAAHLIINQERHVLNYLRLIERDGPLLNALQRPFIPSDSTKPLVIRSISYAGEKHPADRKRVIVAPVSQLPLSSPAAIHKFKLLVGPRWFPDPPPDSGIGLKQHENVGKHGYIKLSCEEFPQPSMNIKWGCDIINRLLKEAEDTTESFADIPLDDRHIIARTRKYRSVRSSLVSRPTIQDFPKEWL